jgi:fructokinase
VILVAGETLIDRVVRPDGTTSDHPGGGPFNSARTIGRLGEPVQLISVLGNDQAAQLCLADLVESGVDISLVKQVELTTTLAIATLNESGAASYVFDFETSAARHLESLEIPTDTTFLHVGTLALVLEPFATAVETAINALPDGVALLVDPNCRPSVVTDPAAFLAHVRADQARADVVKLSDDDLDYLRSLDASFPGPADFIAAGTSCVLYTRGGAGVDVIGPWGTQTVSAPRVSVADTVGAGDSLSGGFVAWFGVRGLGRADLANRDYVVAAAEFAVRVAAITVSRVGAEPPTRADLDAFDFSE